MSFTIPVPVLVLKFVLKNSFALITPVRSDNDRDNQILHQSKYLSMSEDPSRHSNDKAKDDKVINKMLKSTNIAPTPARKRSRSSGSDDQDLERRENDS